MRAAESQDYELLYFCYRGFYSFGVLMSGQNWSPWFRIAGIIIKTWNYTWYGISGHLPLHEMLSMQGLYSNCCIWHTRNIQLKTSLPKGGEQHTIRYTQQKRRSERCSVLQERKRKRFLFFWGKAHRQQQNISVPVKAGGAVTKRQNDDTLLLVKRSQ